MLLFVFTFRSLKKKNSGPKCNTQFNYSHHSFRQQVCLAAHFWLQRESRTATVLTLCYCSLPLCHKPLSWDRGPKWNAEGKHWWWGHSKCILVYTLEWSIKWGVRNSANVQCNSYLFSSQNHKNNFYTLGIFFSSFKGAAYS